MSRPTPTPERSTRGTWTLIGLLLAPAIVLPLLIPIYDRTDPTLFGFPFYFWFQFALIPVAAALTVTAFVLSQRADRINRTRRLAARKQAGR